MFSNQSILKNQIWLEDIIRRALEEDLGPGDVTSGALIKPDVRGKAVLIAKEKMILAGLNVFCTAFSLLSSEIEFELYFEDGQQIPEGEKICLLRGPLRSILEAERTALNFIQRMSGIATLTRAYVDRVGSRHAKVPKVPKVIDTRKTAPGLRNLDKYAVRIGGGFNHRFGLFDGILIKDNHIDAAGSISEAVKNAREQAPHTLKVEVEVEDLEGVKEAVRAGADIIMLDNMPPAMMKKAVRLTGEKALLEASGNINLENIDAVADTGVDLISVGALTHSPRAMDISLQVIPEE